MKVFANCLILILILGTLVIGGVSTFMTYSATNAKYNTASYDKSGKRIVSYDVGYDEEDLKIKKLSPELITDTEQNQRYTKYCKLVMDKAKRAYNDDKSNESKSLEYSSATVDYERAQITERNYKRQLFVSCTQMLFYAYLPVAAVLFVALAVSMKSGRNRN